jgi:hypothetical protein
LPVGSARIKLEAADGFGLLHFPSVLVVALAAGTQDAGVESEDRAAGRGPQRATPFPIGRATRKSRE